jgi:molybdopterin molybdotransferase
VPLADILSVREARLRILSHFNPVGTTQIKIDQALDRVLADDLIANMEVPPFANSSMDGFAVRSSDSMIAKPENPVRLQVVIDIPAGMQSSLTIQNGQAARIMTGAPLPNGADAVIPIEATEFYQSTANGIGDLVVSRPVKPGDYVRPKGEDIRPGQHLLTSGHRLKPQDIGLFAMLGMTSIPVYEKPRVALLSTGDELIPPDQALTPGKIHDSNSYMLSALINQSKCEPLPLGIVKDDFTAVRHSLDKSVDQKVDLILSSAGVSVGAYDYVREVVQSQGRMDFWKVNIRPGKPITFGFYRDVPLIGLPGNPVSAFVCFEVFVRPVLDKLAGTNSVTNNIRVQTMEDIESDGRESYLRARISLEGGKWLARLTGHQGSGNLLSLVQANALLIIPSGVKSLPAGSDVEAWLL